MLHSYGAVTSIRGHIFCLPKYHKNRQCYDYILLLCICARILIRLCDTDTHKGILVLNGIGLPVSLVGVCSNLSLLTDVGGGLCCVIGWTYASIDCFCRCCCSCELHKAVTHRDCRPAKRRQKLAWEHLCKGYPSLKQIKVTPKLVWKSLLTLNPWNYFDFIHKR